MEGDIIGINRFGASAPGNVLKRELGFPAENVAERAWQLVKNHATA